MTKSTSLTRPQPYHEFTVAHGGYICSGHVLVNYERQLRKLPSLQRSRALDHLARQEAEQLAREMDQSVSSSSICSLRSFKMEEDLRRELGARPGAHGSASTGALVASNVVFGECTCVQQLHSNAMQQGLKANSKRIHKAFRRNLLSPSFTEIGVGTARGEDGSLFMVQLFRGFPSQQQ